MSKEETNILRSWQLKWSRWAVLFRNNQGMFMTMDGNRRVYAGLGKGTSDLIGWREITVTPEMVGKRIAIFCAVEGKTSEGKLSEIQSDFLKEVSDAGGYALVVRSPDDAPPQ